MSENSTLLSIHIRHFGQAIQIQNRGEVIEVAQQMPLAKPWPPGICYPGQVVTMTLKFSKIPEHLPFGNSEAGPQVAWLKPFAHSSFGSSDCDERRLLLSMISNCLIRLSDRAGQR